MSSDENAPDTTDGSAGGDANQTTIRRDWRESGQPSGGLVEAVAAATDRVTTDLPPLQYTIDPEALDALLTGESTSPVEITFSYAGTTVSISDSGVIEVRIA